MASLPSGRNRPPLVAAAEEDAIARMKRQHPRLACAKARRPDTIGPAVET
jgi:hypothetical protein